MSCISVMAQVMQCCSKASPGRLCIQPQTRNAQLQSGNSRKLTTATLSALKDMAVANVLTVLPMLSGFLEIDESMWLCVLCQDVFFVRHQLFLNNSYKQMSLQQHKNAYLAKSLFVTNWSPEINECGLIDCKKRCGRWMPSVARDSNGRMLFDIPAPACDPKMLVIEWVQRHPGRWIVTCSRSCCFKTWRIMQVVKAAQRYEPQSDYGRVLLTSNSGI